MVACHEPCKLKTAASRTRGLEWIQTTKCWSLIFLHLRRWGCLCLRPLCLLLRFQSRCRQPSVPALYQVGLLHLLEACTRRRELQAQVIIKGSLNPVKCGRGRVSSSFSPAVILGSSMVRNVTVPSAKTMSYPGARVNDITKLLPNVLGQDMEIDSIVVHVVLMTL